MIHAEGEFSASQQLANAARVIGSQPATLQLRNLQTLTEIAAEKNSTIVFPLPLELLQGFFNLAAQRHQAAKSSAAYLRRQHRHHDQRADPRHTLPQRPGRGVLQWQ